jgi:L-rhamnose isomerase
MIRVETGGAADPVAAYRLSGYRRQKANARLQAATSRFGIV